jgi:hypothetical protein
MSLKMYMDGREALSTCELNKKAKDQEIQEKLETCFLWLGRGHPGALSKLSTLLKEAGPRLYSYLNEKQEQPSCKVALGLSYLIDRDGKKNSLAAYHFTEAAQIGNKPNATEEDKKFGAAAEYELGLMHYQGCGVSTNLEKSVTYYESAANKGFAAAHLVLANIYEKDSNLDLKKAFMHLTEAAKLHSASADRRLGEIRENGLWGVPKNIEKAVQHYQLSAEKGDVKSNRRLGEAHENGHWGFSKNIEKAVQHYQLAAYKGDVISSYRLGCLYKAGIGIHQDFAQAAKYLDTVAKIGAKQDYSEEFKHAPAAEKMAGVEAMFELADMYEHGYHFSKSRREAEIWYDAGRTRLKSRARQGDTQAMLKLREVYLNGWGVKKDTKKAEEYFSRVSQKKATENRT